MASRDIVYAFKSVSHEIKDLDETKGIVRAYANVYGNEDSDGDISMPGSFKRSVNNNFKRMRVLKDHISTITLGVPLEMDADDSYGLDTITQFNLKKEVSRDMFSDIQLANDNGLNAELSIGYDRNVKRDTKDKRRIVEYKLMEYSFLSAWASNELALVTDLKSIKSHYGVIELLVKMYNLPYSDIRLKQIEALLVSLTHDPSDTQDTQKDDSITADELKSIILKNLSYGTRKNA